MMEGIMRELNALRLELKTMPEHYLKTTAINQYGFNRKQLKGMTTDDIVEAVVAVEYVNAYK
jgi:hypothetical protein